MKLTDFPPNDCRVMLLNILDRYDSAKGRWPPHKGIATHINLSVHEARLLYAAGQWIKKYNDWHSESLKAGGHLGAYPAKHSLKECEEFISQLVGKIDKENPSIFIPDRDMRVMESCQRHLEHYELLTAQNKTRKGNWKKR